MSRTPSPVNPTIVLPKGLSIRRSTGEDTEKLAEFNGRIHGENKEDTIMVDAWTRDLLNGKNPRHTPDSFSIIEETSTGKIVSATNLIGQTWCYEGIPIPVGRPELVGTDPEYRNRGLVRAHFEVIHAESRRRGHILQGITGIPYYYRLFGYEMTVELQGWRAGYKTHLPKLEEGAAEPVTIRPAVASDIPFIMECDEEFRKQNLLSCLRDERDWLYVISGMSEKNVCRLEIYIISTPDGSPLGFYAMVPYLWGGNTLAACTYMALKKGASWYEVSPPVMRALWAAGLKIAERDHQTLEGVVFGFGSDHPLYQVLKDRLPRSREPYGWYMRVPDLPGFIRRIAPALESRLESSVCAGFSGDLRLNFYRSTLRIAFEKGKLTASEAYPAKDWLDGDGGYPGLTFYHLLFGYRSHAELRYIYPDCWIDDGKRPLLEALFPKKISHLWPMS
ncbi:MAG TPA: GNAT family N-acetyltransferase [Longilinea sp.]|nr:GNAT family N-acetyltransferase [Longilinea sp.]